MHRNSFLYAKTGQFPNRLISHEATSVRFSGHPAAAVPSPDGRHTEGSRTFRNALFNSDSRLQFGHAGLFLSDSDYDYSGNSLRGSNREHTALPSGSFVHYGVQSFEKRHKAGNGGIFERAKAAKQETHRRGVPTV